MLGRKKKKKSVFQSLKPTKGRTAIAVGTTLAGALCYWGAKKFPQAVEGLAEALVSKACRE